jgi:hypothetical protein
VYRVIVENYPTNLITKDRWEAVPLLYACWGAAPAEVIQFLLESYQALYPTYEFNWTIMVETMGRCETPNERIENLLNVRQLHFPDHPLDWDYLLNDFVMLTEFRIHGEPFIERMQYLFMCGFSTRVEALSFKLWRDHITNMIQTADFKYNGEESQNILHRIQEKLAHFEDELPKLKEVTTILELALWKMQINNNKSYQDTSAQSHERIKTDELSSRQQYRVTGADVVIGPVLQFLIATGDEIYDYDRCLIEEDLVGEENLDGDEVHDSDINLD